MATKKKTITVCPFKSYRSLNKLFKNMNIRPNYIPIPHPVSVKNLLIGPEMYNRQTELNKIITKLNSENNSKAVSHHNSFLKTIDQDIQKQTLCTVKNQIAI